jgi:opacity protein-like surface antigen
VENLSEYTETTKRNFLINNLNVFSKMLFVTIPELQLYTSAGFTTYKYKNTTTGRSHIGFNAGAGLSYDIFEQIYFLASYSFIKATLKQNDGESLTSDKHHLARLGAGFKF